MCTCDESDGRYSGVMARNEAMFGEVGSVEESELRMRVTALVSAIGYLVASIMWTTGISTWKALKTFGEGQRLH